MTKKKKQEPVFRFNLTLTKLDNFYLTCLHNSSGNNKTTIIREAIKQMYDKVSEEKLAA